MWFYPLDEAPKHHGGSALKRTLYFGELVAIKHPRNSFILMFLFKVKPCSPWQEKPV